MHLWCPSQGRVGRIADFFGINDPDFRAVDDINGDSFADVIGGGGPAEGRAFSR